MANLVVDASLAAAWCFGDENRDYANRVLRVLPSVRAFVPQLWAYELRNSVLMGVRRGRIDSADAGEFLRSLGALNIALVTPVSYDGIFQLADETGLSVYDAAYLDVARREAAELASLDRALQRAALAIGVRLF